MDIYYFFWYKDLTFYYPVFRLTFCFRYNKLAELKKFKDLKSNGSFEGDNLAANIVIISTYIFFVYKICYWIYAPPMTKCKFYMK